MSALGESCAADTYWELVETGQRVTIKRLIGTGPGTINVEAMAVIRNFVPEQVAQGAVQGRQTVLISNREIENGQWPGPPRRGDRIEADGRTMTILGVDTTVIDGTTVRHEIQAQGQ